MASRVLDIAPCRRLNPSAISWSGRSRWTSLFDVTDWPDDFQGTSSRPSGIKRASLPCRFRRTSPKDSRDTRRPRTSNTCGLHTPRARSYRHNCSSESESTLSARPTRPRCARMRRKSGACSTVSSHHLAAPDEREPLRSDSWTLLPGPFFLDPCSWTSP